MSPVGSAERDTQDRVISLFKNDLGYEYLGDWSDRPGNSNIEEQILEVWLLRKGYSARQISKAIYSLTSEAKVCGAIQRALAQQTASKSNSSHSNQTVRRNVP